jgi:hypothetical protein
VTVTMLGDKRGLLKERRKEGLMALQRGGWLVESKVDRLGRHLESVLERCLE